MQLASNLNSVEVQRTCLTAIGKKIYPTVVEIAKWAKPGAANSLITVTKLAQKRKGSYNRNCNCLFLRGPTWARTRHPLIMSQVL